MHDKGLLMEKRCRIWSVAKFSRHQVTWHQVFMTPIMTPSYLGVMISAGGGADLAS